MRNSAFLFASVCCLLSMAACKKSSNGGNSGPNPLTGSWTFNGETSNASTTSTVAGPVSIKVVNLVNFNTTNNSGDLTFNSDSMVVAGLGYDIDTTVTTYTYVGATIDTAISPLTVTTTPFDTLVTYKLVGQDSISFPNGSPFAFALQGFQPPVQLNGFHFSINGNTLTLHSTINQTGQETYNGITAPTTVAVTSVITLTKH